MRRVLQVGFIILPLLALLGQQQHHDQELFRQIFGDSIHFDPAAVAKAKSLPSGGRLKLDTNGDGKIDTIYFIDPDPKHDDRLRPILVKAIDRDGDMERTGSPDRDSDMYVVDLHADGTIDSVVEYIDRDHDQALDEMAIYTYSANSRNLGTDTIQVWWSRDIGHDHRLWETVNYRYQQKECQFRSDFNGDEVFSSYVFSAEKRRWIPGWENPFGFYDEDHDQLSEVVIRFSGKGDQVESMRYSFDADNDTRPGNPHDYDFGFTCVASRKESDGRTIALPSNLTKKITLQGFPADPVLGWKHARKFGEKADWGRVLMAWVENNNNVDSRPDEDPHSRWEGVIASPTDKFPQVGGPPVGPYNTRYETDLDNSGRMQLYYSAVDRRIHLRGADEGWLKADYDFDGKVDFEIRYEDSDKDGIVDTWKTDVDGDGTMDRTIQLRDRPQPVPLNYRVLNSRYTTLLDDAVAQNRVAIDAMKAFLRMKESSFREDQIEQYFRDRLSDYRSSAGVGRRIHDSREGERFYQDLVRERYFLRVERLLAGQPALLRTLDKLYASGDYRQFGEQLRTPH
jgi:hypothetical protein